MGYLRSDYMWEAGRRAGTQPALASGASQKGASKRELIEFLNVAMTMQGCPGEEWPLKALSAYDELIEGKSVAEDGCCKSKSRTPGNERRYMMHTSQAPIGSGFGPATTARVQAPE